MSASLLRELRHRDRLRYRPGVERVSIDELISPLRYDIMVRADYFRFLDQMWGWFVRDFDSFVEASRDHPYFVWFTEIHCRRLHPKLLKDEQTHDAAFRRRIRKSARLLARFRHHGFDTRPPMLLHGGRRIAPTATGKTVVRSVYAGNGCHRIALLKLGGFTWLEPKTYVVARHRTFAPRDNTAILLECLGLSRSEYLAFLSLGYGGSRQETRDALLAHVRRHQPDRLREVIRVMSFDEARLSAHRRITGGR
jgi:hypothetical protein